MKVGSNLDRPVAAVAHFDLLGVAAGVQLDWLGREQILAWLHRGNLSATEGTGERRFGPLCPLCPPWCTDCLIGLDGGSSRALFHLETCLPPESPGSSRRRRPSRRRRRGS